VGALLNEEISVRMKDPDVDGTMEEAELMDFVPQSLSDYLIVDIDDIKPFLGCWHRVPSILQRLILQPGLRMGWGEDV
jgi:hypothetical protein